MRRALASLVGVVVAALLPGVVHAACFDIGRGQPSVLSGTLDYVMFAGPPNFEDVQKGDTPEPRYILRLSSPICITGGDLEGARVPVKAVQLNERTAGQLKRFLHQIVTVELADQMNAETGHHHEPLLSSVVRVRLAAGPAPIAQPLDFTDEYGTPATVIRAFYAALGDGRGETASLLIVPEKRDVPAFSPSQLSRFYGSLRIPVSVVDIAIESPDSYVVHYRYATASRTCDGRAVVRTVERSGRAYIESIRALNGC